MSIWPDQSGNRLNQTYLKGFLDVSGGDIILRNNGSISIGKNATMNGNINVGNNAILNGNVTIGQSTIPTLFYDFETIDICNNINNVIQVIPVPQLISNTNNIVNSVVVDNQKDALSFKNGQYDISASSFISTNFPHHAFNGSNGNSNFWQSNANYSNGVYTGSTSTAYSSNGSSSIITGEWLQIALPYSMILTKYSFLCNTPTQGPKTYYILGSGTINNTWTLITNNTVSPNSIGSSPYSTSTPTTFYITNYNPQPFKYYRLVINAIWSGTSVNTAIQQWNLYGNPYISNSVISTNLLYNYGSKTYEALFSSNPSNMMDSTNYITGSSSVLLDGINNSIVLPYFPVTDSGLTFSCWIRPTFPTVGTKLYTIFEFMNASNIITLILNTFTGNLYWNITNPIQSPLAPISSNIVITPSVWTHIVWTMKYDNGNNSTWQLYVNGVNVFSNRQFYPIVGDFFINYIGRSSILNTTYPNNTYQDFSGNIDQFRIYNMVLTSFQIGSLYNIQKTLIVNNSLYYHYNDVFLGNKLAVLGDTSLNNNVTIYGNTASTSSTTGALIVSGGVGIGGNTNISASTISTSSTTGAFTVIGGAGIGGNLYVGSTTESMLTTNGSLVVSGGMGIAKNVNMGGNLKIGVNSTSFDLSSGSIIVTGGAAITGNLNIGAKTVIYSTTTSTSSTTGALTISGGLGMVGNLYVGSTTESDSTTIGSLVVSGGVGIAKNTNIGGNLIVTQTYDSTTTGNGSFVVYGGAGIGGKLNIAGNTKINASTASVSTSTGALVVIGGVGISGNINIGGTISSSGISSPQFNSPNNILTTNTTPNYYLLGNLSGKNFKIEIITGANAAVANTQAEICTISGIIFTDGTLTASYYTNGQSLVIDNIYFNKIGSGSGSTYDIYIHTTTNYVMQCFFNVYNINGTWTVNPTLNTAISSGTVTTLTATWITLENYLKITSTRISNSSDSGAFIVSGGVGISGNVNVASTTISTDLSSGSFITKGGAAIAGNVNIGGVRNVIYSIASSTSSTTGALTISGGLGMGGNLYVGSTTESDSTTIGSLVVSGGVGIAKNANIGGDVKMGRNSTSFDLSSGSLIVSGGAAITGNLNIGAKTIIYSIASSISPSTGALTISGGIGIGENANIKGNTTVNGTINAAGLMTCSGGLVTLTYTIVNTPLTPNVNLHNSYIYFNASTSVVTQILPTILPNLSSIIHLVNNSNKDHIINASNSPVNQFLGSGFSSGTSSVTLKAGYSMRLIGGNAIWFVDNYRYNNSQNVDTATDQAIYGNKIFNGNTSCLKLDAFGITDTAVTTTLQSLYNVNGIQAGGSIQTNGSISGVGITDTGTVTTVNSVSSSGTISARNITDNGNTILGTSNSNILTVNSLTKIKGGMTNTVFNLNSLINPTSAFYGATINFLASISSNINQHIPSAVISGGYNTTIFLANYSNSQQTIWSDGGNYIGQQISSGATPNIGLPSNYCFTLRSDGTNWSVQNTQHITNILIDNAAIQTIGGNKTFSSVLNINGGVFYRNISITANNTTGDATWYGSTIDISNSTTWTTTLPSAANNTNIYIWNHSAVNQTFNAASGEGFFGYNVTNNSTSVSIPAYSMITIRSTSTYTTKAWYVQAYIREGSFFMDNYSNQIISGIKTFTGSSNFGTSNTDIMTVNANMVLNGGFYTNIITYSDPGGISYDSTYLDNSAYGSLINIINKTSNNGGSLFLPLLNSNKFGVIYIFNNTNFNLNIRPQTGNTLSGNNVTYNLLNNGLLGLSPNTLYCFISTSNTNWYVLTTTKINSTNIDNITDQTIGGNKTFSNTVTLPGITLPNTINSKKIVLYNYTNNILSTNTSFYGFGIAPTILSYNVDSLNSNHVFYCADDNTGSATGYTELLRIGNAGIVANKDLTINTGYKLITPTITLNGADLGTTLSALTGNVGGLPTLNGTNNWSGPNTFTQTVTALAFNVTSDYRIKDDIYSLHDLSDQFTVDKLKPVCYYNNQTKKQDIGLVAHELQEEYPFLVNGEKDGDNYQSVNYIGLIGILIKEIQELKTRIALLEQKEIEI